MTNKTIQEKIAMAMFDYARYCEALNDAVNTKASSDEWEAIQERKEWTQDEVLKSLKALEEAGLDIPILKFLR